MTRTALELVALANRWQLLDAPALSLPGGTVELGQLRPIEVQIGIRTTRGNQHFPISSVESGSVGEASPPPPADPLSAEHFVGGAP